ncbi:MAG: helix-turn-helix transcriptional regulator [Chloroflexota bacterium]
MTIPLRDFRYPVDEDIAFELIYIPESAPIKRVNLSRPNRVNFYEIFWITAGEGVRYIDFKEYTIQPNTLFLLTPGQVHFWKLQQQPALDGYAILFLEEFLQLGTSAQVSFLRELDFFHRIDRDPVIYLTDGQAAVFQHLVSEMQSEYQTQKLGRTHMLQSLVQIFLIQAQRHYQMRNTHLKPTTEALLIDQLRTLIDQQFLSQRNVQAYADMLGITAGYLSKIAKTVTGVSAGVLIRERLVLEAKRLLAHTDNSVAEISFELQFDDPSYFGRFFKRETGQSPLSFRRNSRQSLTHVLSR